MSGAITRMDVLRNPVATIRGFGWGVFLRAIFGRCDTFLVCCCDLRSKR